MNWSAAEEWMSQSICRRLPPAQLADFFPPLPVGRERCTSAYQDATTAMIRRATAWCSGCPVLPECEAHTRAVPPSGGVVQGGRYYR